MSNTSTSSSSSILSRFLGSGAGGRRETVAIDLGQRTTKAVHLQRHSEGYELLEYALLDAPVSEKAASPEVLGEHLKAVTNAIKYRGRPVTLVLGVSEALLRQAEMPVLPASDMRLMLKYNSKNYLQQELPDHVFDCHAVGVAVNGNASTEPGARSAAKTRVLIGAAKQQTLDDIEAAAKHAALVADQVTPALACSANAFEVAMPETFAKEVVALVDIGFKSSSITILAHGELALSRVVLLGADKLTAGLAEAMGVSYAEAEGIKVGLPEEVQGAMQGLIMPLGRELRASIDFFEHQQDKTVSQVYVSGGSARSQFIVESLQSELMIQTKSWNPVSGMKVSLPPQKLGEVEQVAAQLAIAIGGAIATL